MNILGKIYRDGEVIVRQGEPGDCMYVILAGQVEVLKEQHGRSVSLATIGGGDFFGEMALFLRETRSATVRARGEARVLTLDKKTFLRRVHTDPSLAYQLLQCMCSRIRKLSNELAQAKESVRGPLPHVPAEVLAGASQPGAALNLPAGRAAASGG